MQGPRRLSGQLFRVARITHDAEALSSANAPDALRAKNAAVGEGLGRLA